MKTPDVGVIFIMALIMLVCSCLAFTSGLSAGLLIGEFNTQATVTAMAAQLPTTTPDESAEAATTRTATAESPVSIAAAVPPPERPAPQGDLLLEADFSDAQAWEVAEYSGYELAYFDDHYVITVNDDNIDARSITSATFDDFIVSVDTHQLDGPDDNNYGVIVRYRSRRNHYAFNISGDGFYTFYKYENGDYFDIIPWQKTDLVEQGNNQNTIRVEAIGKYFNLYINGELADVAIDSTFSRGDIGLMAGTYDEVGVVVAFDALRVWSVDED